MEMSVEMIRAVQSLGFSALYATPHQRAGMFMPARAAIDDAYARVGAEVAKAGAGPELGLGAENFWDDVLLSRIRQGGVPTYGHTRGQTRTFLFEVSHQLMPPAIEAELFQLHVQGYLPVMAHPERYTAIQRDVSLAERLGRHAAMLIDLGALEGAHGKAEMKTARRLVLDGLAHAAASDIHRPEDLTSVAAGMEWIRKQRSPAVLQDMLSDSPRRLLAGEMPDPPR
jgi:protein-tyrosine phosphatase